MTAAAASYRRVLSLTTRTLSGQNNAMRGGFLGDNPTAFTFGDLAPDFSLSVTYDTGISVPFLLPLGALAISPSLRPRSRLFTSIRRVSLGTTGFAMYPY